MIGSSKNCFRAVDLPTRRRWKEEVSLHSIEQWHDINHHLMQYAPMQRLLGRSSERMGRVQAPIIPVVAEWIRQNPGTLSLGQGVVFYGPPPEVRKGIDDFFADPQNHKYKPVYGIPPLLEAITAKLETENTILVGQGNRVVVTAGSNMAFSNTILAITEPGDEVILQTPYYFNHEMALQMLDVRPVLIPTDERYQPRPELIRKAVTPRTRAIVTVSPNNPSGAVYEERLLKEINSLCEELGLIHISDEAYELFTFNGRKHFPPGSIPGSERHTVSLFSLSKACGFASWRVGFQVIPEHLFEATLKIQDTQLICPPVISQFAAAAALPSSADYCRGHLESLRRNRDVLLEGLASLGERCLVPASDGAFYLLLKLQTQIDSMELSRRLIVEHKVAAIPGIAFGIHSPCLLRVAYGALDAASVEVGSERLVNGLRRLLT